MLDAPPPDGEAPTRLDDLPAVDGDDDELTQVFQNLIDNAIKYGRTGTTIRIAGWTAAPAPRPSARDAAAHAAARPAGRGDRGDGRGRRHRARAPAAPDRALLPRRHRALARARRHRARPRHRQAHRQPPSRRARHRQHGRGQAARSRSTCRSPAAAVRPATRLIAAVLQRLPRKPVPRRSSVRARTSRSVICHRSETLLPDWFHQTVSILSQILSRRPLGSARRPTWAGRQHGLEGRHPARGRKPRYP